jgi:hypothetical protein
MVKRRENEMLLAARTRKSRKHKTRKRREKKRK